jgi:hypothetical protein
MFLSFFVCPRFPLFLSFIHSIDCFSVCFVVAVNIMDSNHGTPRSQINLIAPPSFVLTTTVMDKDKGLELLTSACDAISAKIKENGGDMTLKVPVRKQSAESCVCIGFFLVLICECSWLSFFSNFSQPRAITDRDEKSLASTLELLDKQAQEELDAEFD